MSKLVRTSPHLSEKIWGGDFLSQIKNIETKRDPLGETWEVSTLDNASSFVGGVKLSDICCLSYLVKFIDTKANLSIQVHPDDEYAKLHEDSSKTECWLILDSTPGSGVYLGLKSGVTKREFFTALSSGINLDKYLNFYPSKKGDFFFIPAGAIHAIGSGVVLCEVQQSSDTTYRVWDWNRVDSSGNSRELHVEKAKETINFTPAFNERLKKSLQKNLLEESQVLELIKHKDFHVILFNYIDKKEVELALEQRSSIVVLQGKLCCEGLELNAFESGFVLEPGTFEISFLSSRVSFLIVS